MKYLLILLFAVQPCEGNSQVQKPVDTAAALIKKWTVVSLLLKGKKMPLPEKQRVEMKFEANGKMITTLTHPNPCKNGNLEPTLQ